MAEFRQSPTSGEWVVIAGERGKRPSDYAEDGEKSCPSLEEYDVNCPFCPGGKAENDEVLYQVVSDGKWSLKVLSNKFAALSDAVEPKHGKKGLLHFADGYGKAEVILESPFHNQSIATMTLRQVEAIVEAYKIRYNEMLTNPHISFINIFKNYGPKAGASLRHPHSQIIGSLVTPPNVSYQIYYARRFFENEGQCVYCAMMNEELANQSRIVEDTKHFVVFCAYASKSPYEVRIIPKRHSAVFGNIEDEESKELAAVLKRTLKRLYDLLNDPDYNFIIRSITTDDGESHYYHWYIVIIPKITKPAGFEIGTGIYINTVPPEICAEQLRNT